ncbi:MAG: hypothetical protein EHM19_06715, partial [Candidatus Latescibacterota bacterium]
MKITKTMAMTTVRGPLWPALFAAILAASGAAQAQQPRTLRIAMTASDVPTTTGMPNNGFEGMRFLGYPS